MDAKDILGLPKTSLPAGPQEKRPRPPRDSQRKPDGVSREVYALTGGLAPPLMPAVEVSSLKRKQQQADEKITWQWLPFTSSARTDNLQLYHWVRVVNGVPPTGDYSFAKFNKSVDVLKYTDEEYEKFLNDPTWTKEETDQLFDLCEHFDLRFIVIADRFPYPRSVEELKSRYYSVSRTLLIARATSSGDVSVHPLVKDPYNAAQEVERKHALAALLSQTKQQEHKDAEILAEAKRIAESRLLSKAGEGSAPVNATIDTEIGKVTAPAESVSPSSNVLPSAGAPTATIDGTSTPASLRMLGVYLRTNVLEQMVQAANSSAGLRTIKRVDQTLQDLGVNIKLKVPTKAVCAEHLELRKEILTLLNLQKQLQYKEAEASANRDGHTETPGTPKRSHRGDQDRTFIPESVGFGGEKSGKRDHKRKSFGSPFMVGLAASTRDSEGAMLACSDKTIRLQGSWEIYGCASISTSVKEAKEAQGFRWMSSRGKVPAFTPPEKGHQKPLLFAWDGSICVQPSDNRKLVENRRKLRLEDGTGGSVLREHVEDRGLPLKQPAPFFFNLLCVYL